MGGGEAGRRAREGNQVGKREQKQIMNQSSFNFPNSIEGIQMETLKIFLFSFVNRK